MVGKLYTKNKTRFPANVEYGDIIKGLPVEIASCDAVYCSHVLEHLSLEDFRSALRNTHKILKKGGTFRFVLPDLEFYIDRYKSDPSPEAALSFLRETSLGREKRERGIRDFLSGWLGNSQHLWMWDYKSLELELNAAGFFDIRKAQLGDSLTPVFKEVETPERWENCLGVECRG
jgi:predicted SAM-dependent methyltransferase